MPEQMACLRKLYDLGEPTAIGEWEVASGTAHTTMNRWVKGPFAKLDLVEKVDPAQYRSPYRLTPKGLALFSSGSD